MNILRHIFTSRVRRKTRLIFLLLIFVSRFSINAEAINFLGQMLENFSLFFFFFYSSQELR